GAGAVRRPGEPFPPSPPVFPYIWGRGRGWIYGGGGGGASIGAMGREEKKRGPADLERLKTINYGGGARWFAKPHLAFSLDVRIYAINPGTPYFPPALGSPRTNLLVIGAGISIK